MAFLFNAWYAAAWADELGNDMVERMLLERPLICFRDDNGKASVIGGICPHRFAPLSLGCKVSSGIQCKYHGLIFNGDGICIGQAGSKEKISSAVKVPSYPCVEKHGVIWVWMGERELADPGCIPDFSYLEDPNRKTVKGVTKLAANFHIISDNLLDLGHAQYVHKDSLGEMSPPQSITHDSSERDGTVTDLRIYHCMKPPRFWADALPGRRSHVDFWLEMRWDQPSMMRNHVGVSLPGESLDHGAEHFGTHLLTPETETSTHYFFGSSRNYAQSNPDIDEAWRQWQHQAFDLEDGPICRAVQQMTPIAKSLGMREMLLQSDKSAVMAARILQKAIDQERRAMEPTG